MSWHFLTCHPLCSYGVALSYVLADAIEKGWSERKRQLRVILRTVDPPSASDPDTRVASDKAVSSLGEGRRADVEEAEADTWPAIAAGVDALMWHGVVRAHDIVQELFISRTSFHLSMWYVVLSARLFRS
jgi:hypothetical protein